MRLAEAADLYLGDVARRCSPRTEKRYNDELKLFINHLGDKFPVEDVKPADCLLYLNKFNDKGPKTKAIRWTVLNQFFKFAYRFDYTDHNPMEKIPYPKVPPAEDRGVKSISSQDVQKVIAACETWTEKLCIWTLAYMGVRRRAANDLRWRDVDLELGFMKFREKGGKTIRKPIPLPLLELLKSYVLSGEGGVNESSPARRSADVVPTGIAAHGAPEPDESLLAHTSPPAESYVIPSYRPTSDHRNDRFIWRVVKEVGARAGVDTHCHAFRAAFAVHYLESTNGDTIGLQNAMGHAHIATTQGYWRRLNKEASMEPMRSLDWGVSASHLPDETLHEHSMTKQRLRGKDSNLDSKTKLKASKSPRVSKSEGRETSRSMTRKTNSET